MPGAKFQKRVVLLVAVILGVVAAFGVGDGGAWGFERHRPQHQAKQQILSMEDQWRTAALSGDLKLIESLLSDDYVGISWTGEVNTKAMQIDRMRSKSLVISKLEGVDSKVKVLGTVAIVTGLANVQGTTDGVPMVGTFRYTRVYQRLSSGVWKVTNFEATRVPDHTERRTRSPSTR